VERELGTIKQVFHEHADSSAAINVLHVAATAERPVHTLITSGMSDLAMNTGTDARAPRHIELMMTLPRQWSMEGLKDTDHGYWPIRTLMTLAHLPQQRDTALVWGQTVPNGEPPAPYADDTRLCGVILAPSLLVPKEFYVLGSGDQRIEFYAAIPLYKEELALREQHGMEHLLTTLIDHRVNDLVDIKRRNVARKRFGFF
jgi:hypothetical protein